MGDIFSLEALQANEGDCFILHYGSTENHKLILVDCGPAGIYKGFLKKRLADLKKKLFPQAPLPIDLLLISHIDDDHITGAVDMTNELIELRSKAPLELTQIWFNSFDDIIGKPQDDLTTSLSLEATNVLSSGDIAALPDGIHQWDAAVIASVQKGRTLRDNARKLNVFMNPTFPRLVKGPASVTWDDLRLTILGPDADRLTALQQEWDKGLTELKKKGKLGKAAMAELATLINDKDLSPTNLSSIVVLAEMKGKSMLLTGDARGDFVVEGLEKAGKLKDGKIHLDILKMPHHGSDRNVPPDFFKTIIAETYVFSANGKYGNPDISTMESLVMARPKENLNLYFTNHDGEDKKLHFILGSAFDKFFAKEKGRGRKHNTVFRDTSRDRSAEPATLMLNLLDQVTY